MKRWIHIAKKVLSGGGLFLLVLFITYKIVFAKMDFNQLGGFVKNLNPWFVLCGILTALFAIGAESFNTRRNLRILGEKQSFWNCVVYSFAGNFFSAITPSATGGQPMQLYFMHRNNVPVSKGTLATLMDLGSYQIAIVTIGLVSYICYFRLINRSLGMFLPVLWVGIVLNVALLLITFIAIFSGKFIYTLVTFLSKIVGAFTKDKGARFTEIALEWVRQYKLSANVLRKNKGAYFVNCLITIIRIIAIHAAPFWVYKSLGLSGVSPVQMIALQSTVYISCAALPFPGGVGIGESAFLLYFKEIFAAGTISSAMLLSRVIGFYSIVAVCGIVLGIIGMAIVIKGNQKKIIGQ